MHVGMVQLCFLTGYLVTGSIPGKGIHIHTLHAYTLHLTWSELNGTAQNL
jgi:hypothetical protein